jgi:hypothetical protein
MSASELGMVPFETALSPIGFPGNGSPLFLQSHTPITITREIRRGCSLPLNWNRPPKILFAFATPPDLAPVPAEAHLRAIRAAINPWVKIKDDPDKSVAEVKQLLTVLPDASLQEIRDLCSRENFTHVHILAHGAPFSSSGDRRFGLALCCHDDKTRWEVVDGESLAIALTGKNTACSPQEAPSVVSLATCDSGNVSSVLTPGGSIAHELHGAGIPWVIASQFPLWMKASSLAVSELYSGLLAGEDPRSVLYDLRRRLRTDCPSTHDWASIVAYATVPPDFENQLSQFRDKQMRAKLSVKLNRLDELFGGSQPGQNPTRENLDELEAICKDTRAILASWCNDLADDPAQRLKPATALRLCMSGASEKRLGVAYLAAGRKDEAMSAFKNGQDYYCSAIEADSSSTWPITQYLFMYALLPADGKQGRLPFGIPAKDWWFIATRMAQCEVDTARGAFALTDMVELSLLGCFYDQPCNQKEILDKIDNYIKQIIQLEHKNPIHRRALLHQLGRYQYSANNELWDDLVKKAIAKLSPETQANKAK